MSPRSGNTIPGVRSSLDTERDRRPEHEWEHERIDARAEIQETWENLKAARNDCIALLDAGIAPDLECLVLLEECRLMEAVVVKVLTAKAD